MASNVLSIVGILLLVYGFWRINKELSFPGKWALVPVFSAVLIITAGSKAWINRIFLSNKILVWFGLISFPLYLWHWPMLSFARIVEVGVPSSNIRIVAVALSILFAWLTYKFVEYPLRNNNNGKVKVAILILLISIIGYSGYNIYIRDGLKFRTINKINEGVIEALSYDAKKGFRGGECFIDVLDEKSNKFSSICGEKKSGIPSILIWGDSHSASLYRGFESFAESKNYVLYQFTASGCPPILDFYISNRKECFNSNQFVYKEIERLKPDTIVLSAYWSMYDGTGGWENLDIDKLVSTISKLKLLGIKNIVLIGHLPSFTVNQADLLRRNTFFNEISTRTYSKFKPTVKLYDNKIRDVAFLMDIEFISPLDVLCDTNGCLLSATNKNILPLSFDYGHLNSNGSIFLVSKFIELKLLNF
jgi:hypothetical protein